ncbi:unnamed protein product [Prorocentrum cordatum]|uniref:Uncharacterized protein n=1 Tax=Prorocentrum cordatum TaxID=2364126 RepID=A0ABN9X9M4_9DINO|nr:unnamed protein product [Polarella glacialis]
MTLPWGIQEATMSEMQQVALGNQLYRTAIYLILLGLPLQVSAILEHPAPAVWCPQAPSSWHQPEVRWLAGLPQAEILYLDQCQFGQLAQKPTQLLTVNLPEPGRELAAHPGGPRCRHTSHRGVYGRDGRGGWRTAPLKECPPQMCRAMAAALYARRQKRDTTAAGRTGPTAAKALMTKGASRIQTAHHRIKHLVPLEADEQLMRAGRHRGGSAGSRYITP